MKTSTPLALLFAVAIFVSAALVGTLARDVQAGNQQQNQAAASEPEEGFQPLFDGKSLEGWEGDRTWFRVEDQAIVAGTLERPIPRNEFLSTRREYGDFELRLKVKVDGEGANAGIQIRSQRIPNHHEMIGYQADVGNGWWGKLYDESRRNRILAGPADERLAQIVKTGEWNDYRIRCEGRRIQLWLNGEQTADYTEPDEAIPQRGLIALQIHSGGPSQAWYKEIRIRELDRSESR